MKKNKIIIAGITGLSLAIIGSILAFAVQSGNASLRGGGGASELIQTSADTEDQGAGIPKMASLPRVLMENFQTPPPKPGDLESIRPYSTAWDGISGPNQPHNPPFKPETPESLAILVILEEELSQYMAADMELIKLGISANSTRRAEIAALRDELRKTFSERRSELARLHREAK